jgi:peptidoglycan/xylan/chitin deacetylase (PgdA/CDA1 family)
MAAAARQPDGHGEGLATLLKLAALAVLGICAVSIPVTVALLLSTTGTSDVLTIGDGPQREHATPATAVTRARCEPERGYYALTFEGGPDAATTRRLVVALERSRAVATFFDIGGPAARRVDLVDLQRSVGHVANTGYSGTPLTELPREQRIRELQATARVLDYPNVWFRPPRGLTSAELDQAVRRAGLTAVYWTVDAADEGLPAAEIVERALQVRPGGIIRLDEGSEATIDAVPEIVSVLRRRGLCPGLLGEAKATVKGANGIAFWVWAVKP